MCLWFACLALPVFAQAPELGGLLPAGGPRGEVTRVRISGKNLAGAKLHVSGKGVSVKSVQASPAGDSLTAEMMVESSALLGPREVRITTSKGVSNGSRYWVDIYPNRVLEQMLPDSAPPIELDGKSPVVINGRISAKAGRDRFTINASAGDTWSFDCFADRIRSRFDPVLELKDERGVGVRLVESTWENDPRFSHTFAKAGKYTLIVRDSEFNGGPSYTYRLLAGRMPLVESYSPRGAQPGGTVQITTQTSKTAVTVPMGTPMGTYWAEIHPMPGCSVVVPMLIETSPVTEAAAGDSIQPLPALPTVVDGVFTTSARARFKFHASPKEKVLFDLLGRRIGSRIDGEVRVVDSAGKEVAVNDDMNVLSKDARLEFAAPAEGDYTVEVRNVEEVTGANCYYRLSASTVKPGFNLSIATDRLSVPIAGTVAIPVTVERTGGFAGPVDVRVDGLPSGAWSKGGTIPANKTTAEITITSNPDALANAVEVHIVGTGESGGKKIESEAPAWEKYEHRSIDLLLSVEYSYTRPFHLWDMLMCAVSERVDPVIVSTAPSYTLAPGAKVEIPVQIERQPDAKGEIKLELRNLPAKVTADAPAIPVGQNTGKIILTAAADAPIDLTNLIVAAKHGNSTSLAPAVRVEVKK